MLIHLVAPDGDLWCRCAGDAVTNVTTVVLETGVELRVAVDAAVELGDRSEVRIAEDLSELRQRAARALPGVALQAAIDAHARGRR